MTNLVEAPAEWVPGIYQLETNDPLMGGADGIDNLQAKQLAKRTAYLKEQVEAAQVGLATHEAAADPHPVYLTSAEGDAKVAAHAAAADPHPVYLTSAEGDAKVAAHAAAADPHPVYLTSAEGDAKVAAHAAAADPHPVYLTSAEGDAKVAAAVATLVASSPAALDTLNELAAALGNDANFATTINNALAGKAAKDGDTGLIRTLTPAGGARVRELGDIANAATVGGIEFGISYNCNINQATGVWAGRDVADICWLEKWHDTAGTKEFWFAPTAAANAVPVWTKIFAIDMVNGTVTQPTPAQFDNTTKAATTAFVRNELLGLGNAAYAAIFGASLAASGYQKLPNGLIIQWGSSSCGASNPTSVTFPIAFPTVSYSVSITPVNVTAGYQSLAVLNGGNTTGFTWSAFFAAGANVVMNAATTNQVALNWFAIGK